MTSIVLADKHNVVRQGIKMLLESRKEFHVVGETSDGLEARTLVEKLNPDILIVDLMADGMDGVETTRWVSRQNPRTKVIVLSIYADEWYIMDAFKAGASGYILKQDSEDDLIEALHQVTAGHKHISSKLSQYAYVIHEVNVRPTGVRLDSLTARERVIFHLVSQGMTNAEIANTLFISERTVETHRSNMMHKLGVRRHAELLMYAIRQGIAVATIPDQDNRNLVLAGSR